MKGKALWPAPQEAMPGKVTYRTRIDPAATAFTASPWAYNRKIFLLDEEGQYQARWRMFQGEQVPNEDKILFILAPPWI